MVELPTRIKGFRDHAKDTVDELQKQYEESYASKDDRGFALGSVFDMDIIKKLGIDIWRPDIGEHVIDVIPFYAGTQHPEKAQGLLTYKVDFWAHQRIGSMNDFFICTASTWKRPDPICTYMKANYIEDKRQYSAIKASRRCAYLIWCHDNQEQIDKGIQIFEVAHFFFEKKVAEIAKKPRGGGFTDWTHYDHGNHVYWTIGKTGSYEDATGTKRDSIEYTAFQLLQRETPAIPDHILEQSFALDEAIKMHPTDEEVSQAFFGTTQAPPEQTSPQEDERLPKKTALERAREQAQSKPEPDIPHTVDSKPRLSKPEPAPEPERSEDDAVLIEGLICEQCGEDVYDTPSGKVCADGHGDIEGIERATEPAPEKPKPTKPKPAPAETKPAVYRVCPAAEVGGEFGVTIEQLDECDDCNIWEECSDANDAKGKAASTDGGSKLVKR